MLFPTTKDLEDFMMELVKLNETLMIHVTDVIKVTESGEVKVTDRQKRFLERVGQAVSEFQLKEVELGIPGLAKFKFTRKNKE